MRLLDVLLDALEKKIKEPMPHDFLIGMGVGIVFIILMFLIFRYEAFGIILELLLDLVSAIIEGVCSSDD